MKITKLLFVLSLFLITSCESNVKPTVYDGIEIVNGSGETYIHAIKSSITKAVRNSIIKLIGNSIYQNEKITIENTILEYRFNKARKYTKSHTILGRSKGDNKVIVTLKVFIDVEKLRNKLIELKIPLLKTSSLINTNNEYLSHPNIQTLKGETFLVYFNEKELKIPIDLAELAVQKINNFLSSHRLDYVNLNQIVSLKKDREMVEENISVGLSIVQLMAQKLHADIYIVVNGVLDDGTHENGQFQSEGTIYLTAFESSTAKGLGSEQNYIKGIDNTLESAQRKIISNAVIPATNKLISSIIEYKLKPHTYILTLMGNTDHLMRKTFEKTLNKDPNFVNFKIQSATDNQITYRIMYKGLTNNLINGIFKRLRETESFETIKTKMIRRKEIILSID